MAKFNGFVGAAYQLKSKSVNCQRCVNLVPEVDESGSAKESLVLYLKSTYGSESVLEIGDGPYRLNHFNGLGDEFRGSRAIIVSGNEIFAVYLDDNNELQQELIGDMYESMGTCSAVSFKTYDGATVLYNTLIVDGVHSYLYQYESDSPTETFAFPTDPDDPETEPFAADIAQVIVVDGYVIAINDKSNKFYVVPVESIEDPTLLEFSSSEGDIDNIIAIISRNRELIIVNERTTETFANVGNADFPFERVGGGFIQIGSCARHSVKLIDDTIIMLGQDANGRGSVVASKGTIPQRISTHAIEQAMSGYADITTAHAYTYKQEGHSYYVLNFDEATWVYDLTTGMWHERAYTNQGVLERHRGQYHCYFQDGDLHLLADYENNKLYKINMDLFEDDGAPLTRLRISPHVSAGGKQLTISSIQIEVQPGVGKDGLGQGTDPMGMLQLSRNGGFSWGSEMWKSLGKIGEYSKRMIWTKLGISRDLVVSFKVTDPVNVIILGAEIEASVS